MCAVGCSKIKKTSMKMNKDDRTIQYLKSLDQGSCNYFIHENRYDIAKHAFRPSAHLLALEEIYSKL